jgi:glucose-6-phosphate 1-dehydrogenase
VLRAGKALGTRRKEAVVRFRPVHPDMPTDELRIGIDGPLDVTLRITGTSPMSLTAPPPASDLPLYGYVLLDVLEGGSTLSVRGDEAEAAWRVMTPIPRRLARRPRPARGVLGRVERPAAARLTVSERRSALASHSQPLISSTAHRRKCRIWYPPWRRRMLTSL